MFLFEGLNKILHSKKVEPVKENQVLVKHNEAEGAHKQYQAAVILPTNKKSNKFSNKPNYKSSGFPPKKKWEDRESVEPKFKKDDSRAYICYINNYNEVTYILNKNKITASIHGVDSFVQEHEGDLKIKSFVKNYLYENLAKQNVFLEITNEDPLEVKIFLDEEKTQLVLDDIKSLKASNNTQPANPKPQSFKFGN